MPVPLQDLSSFAVPGQVEVLDRGRLQALRLASSRASAEITPHGAHLTAWQPQGQQPVLFLSGKSHFAPDRAIRGGVPLIFPWFGARKDDLQSPAHGFARTSRWAVRAAEVSDAGECFVEMALGDDDETRKVWPHRFEAVLTVRAGQRLRLALSVTNRGTDAMAFEAAFHTYFQVSEVGRVRVRGLEGCEFLDKTDGFSRKRQTDAAIEFKGEIDRMYLNTDTPCTIEDPDGLRAIVVRKSGARATVVWNPGRERAATMADLGEAESRRMVCVETAIAGENGISLKPGETHVMEAVLELAPLSA